MANINLRYFLMKIFFGTQTKSKKKNQKQISNLNVSIYLFTIGKNQIKIMQ